MIKNTFGHFRNVFHHKHLVLIYSFKVGIPLQGIKHDLSKFRFSELLPSIKYYSGNVTPCIKERKDNDMYSSIAVTHTNRNKHHFEYWIDIYKGNLLLRKIPFKYLLEYIIDGISASKTYNKKSYTTSIPLSYFNERKDHYLMHPASKEFVVECYKLYEQSGFKLLKKKRLKELYISVNSKYENTYEVKIDFENNIHPISQ